MTRWGVIRNVLIQQVGQSIVGIIVLRTEADEGIPDHTLALKRFQLAPWNLPNLASAEVMYWFILPALRQVVAVFVLDAWEYWIHRMMHVNKYLYKHVHSRHHRLYVPYAFGALYNHPLEGFFLDTVGGAIAMKLACLSIREAMFFFVLATMKTGMFHKAVRPDGIVDDHCGWDFPWDPFQFLFSNNSVYHDVHHQTYGIKANFSQPFFTFCTSPLLKLAKIPGDRLLGTYMAPPIKIKNPASKEEEIVVQELGNSALTDGSRKRRKSIVTTPTKLNGGMSPRTKTGADDNGTMNGSPKTTKMNGTANGIGSRGMLVVGK